MRRLLEVVFRCCRNSIPPKSNFASGTEFAYFPLVLFAAAGSVTIYSVAEEAPTERKEVPTEHTPARTRSLCIDRFERWLTSGGGNFKALKLVPSEVKDAGLGLLATEEVAGVTKASLVQRAWHWLFPLPQEVIIASFPLSLTVTAQTALDEPDVGGIYHEIYSEGLADERTLMMLYLLIERMRGEGSALHPWLPLLPTSFTTPLFYSDGEMAELAGTTLCRATSLKKRQLEAEWGRLRPAAERLAAAAGLTQKPSMDDFLWAYSLFWSRVMVLPLASPLAAPGVHTPPKQPPRPDPATAPPTTSVSPQNPAASEDKLAPPRMMVQPPLDGVVLGLDFCNHGFDAPCRWDIAEEQKGGLVVGGCVQLLCRRVCLPQAGEEVLIDYGDKSNEELLFLYGFVEEGNPHDQLMLSCPLPPAADWDELMLMRWELLQAHGLRPQIFLPASGLNQSPKTDQDPSEAPAPGLPPEVLTTLELLVMEPQHVQALHQLHTATPDAPLGADGSRNPPTGVSGAGVRLAALTTLARLLEAKVVELEGEDGTGLLEDDLAVLQVGRGQLSTSRWNCVVYRAEQKRLAREYLLLTRRLVSQEMQRLKSLMGLA